MIKIAFWTLAAVDLAGLLLFFVLGLAAAGPSGTNPLSVALYRLVLPAIPLLISMVVFTRAASPPWRLLAFVLVAAPLAILGYLQVDARTQFMANANAAGDLMFFRAGASRELVEAINRNDAVAVAALTTKVDVNRSGMADMTPLVAALRQLRKTPDRQDVLRALIRCRPGRAR